MSTKNDIPEDFTSFPPTYSQHVPKPKRWMLNPPVHNENSTLLLQTGGFLLAVKQQLSLITNLQKLKRTASYWRRQGASDARAGLVAPPGERDSSLRRTGYIVDTSDDGDGSRTEEHTKCHKLMNIVPGFVKKWRKGGLFLKEIDTLNKIPPPTKRIVPLNS